MRWIFFSLLILNAATLVWGVVFEEETLPQQHVEKPFPFKNVETLSLLGEGQSEVIAVANRQSVQRLEKPTKPGGLPNKVDGKPLCEMIGPFKSRDAAQDFRERLSAIDVKADVKDLELPAGAGYWVYLAPFPNRKAAISQYTELQAQKIDSYVIPKGERQNGISLGMFSQENLARKKFKEMQDRGLNPQLDTIERTYREIWVMLEHNEESKMSGLTWTRIMEGLNQLERRQNFCLDVAS